MIKKCPVCGSDTEVKKDTSCENDMLMRYCTDLIQTAPSKDKQPCRWFEMIDEDGNVMEDGGDRTIVYPNGDLLEVAKVRNLLFGFWELNKAETRCFIRLLERMDLKEEYLSTKK